MEAENIDSSLEKQGNMGERREREISSYERRWHQKDYWGGACILGGGDLIFIG